MTLPDALGFVLSCILLVAGVVVASLTRTRFGAVLWWSVVAGTVAGGFLAHVKYADGLCSGAVGWPFVVQRVETGCYDVWAQNGPNLLARVGDILAGTCAALLAVAAVKARRRTKRAT